MAKINFTPAQLDAVEAEGGSLLVSAAAGSGKTAVLTERVIRLLTGKRQIAADRLIIVTFTVAAADEMRRRIRGRLSELLEESPEDNWLQSQQMLLPRAKICTIHSLCSSLIRDHFQKLGLSGGLKIADEAELGVIKKRASEKIFEENYGNQNPAFLDLVEFTSVKNDRPLEELSMAVYDFIRSFAFPIDFLDQSLAMYEKAKSIDDCAWSKDVALHVRDGFAHCVSILQGCMEEMSADAAVMDSYYESFQSDFKQFVHLRDLAAQGRLSEASETVARLQKLSLKSVRKYPSPEFLSYLKDKRKKVWDIAEDLVDRYLCFTEEDFAEDIENLRPRIAALFHLVKEIYQEIEEEKRMDGVLDYSDLEHFALKLLVEKGENGYQKTELACELSESFDEIMIDECQDINEVQNLIFSLLSKGESNLFMVGDVKQSIYRFRKALPKLFIEKRKHFIPYSAKTHTASSKETIILDANFRSRKEICGFVNYVFEQIMSEHMGEISYNEEESLTAGAMYPDYPLACPEVHILDYNREESEEQKNELEARYLANHIEELVSSAYQVSDGQGGLRPCRYRDFAILLRSYSTKAPIYASALKKKQIPFFAQSSEGYFDSYEVSVIINLLRVLDNPLLDVALVSVLMSPMFGFSSDLMAEIRLKGKNRPLWLSLIALKEENEENCVRFCSFLSQMRQIAAVYRVDELIQEIYDRTDFPAMCSVMGDGNRKDANLRLMLTYAGRYEEYGGGGLSGFLRYLDRVVESGQDFSCANTISSSADSVQIMSIHASKGLEFPVCILADCGKKFNKTDLTKSYQMHSDLGFCMKINDPVRMQSYTSFPFEAIRLQSEKESISEEMRVLYVAMTRAKEKLIVLITLPNAENKMKSIADSLTDEKKISPYEVFRAQGADTWILASLLRHPSFEAVRKQIDRTGVSLRSADFMVKGVFVPASSQKIVEERKKQEFYAQPSEELLEKLKKAVEFEYSRLPLTTLPAKLTVTEIAKQSKENKVNLQERPAFLEEQGITPAQRGTILHSFMQFADYGSAQDDLTEEIKRLTDKGFLTATEAKALNRKKIRAFLNSRLYQRMKQAKELIREYKFLYFVPAREVQPDLASEFLETEILIQGIADCLLFEEEGITIVDYKTDYTEDEQVLIDRYYDQLRIYREAIGRAFSRPVFQCLLYSMHLEKEIQIKFDK